MDHLTAFQRDLLIVISGMKDPHGLAVKEEIEGYYESEIHHGRLYPNLDTLVEKGLIDKDEKDRRTNKYTITDAGVEFVEQRKVWENQYVT